MIRKIVPERSGLAAAQTRDVFYDYNHALGLQTHARFDSLDGEGVTMWYDAFGQSTTTLSTMGGEGRHVTYYHDDAGNPHSISHPDGVAFDSDHDSLGRVTAVYEHRASPSMDDYLVRYWYNPAGNRHSAVRGAGSGGFYTIWYRDPLERPAVLANDLPGAGDDMVVELGYNAASQIVGRGVSNDAYAAPTPANAARGYGVNGLNQYTGTTWGGAPNWSFEYDPNGNLKRSVDPAGTGTVGYLYDVENRLVAASGAAGATLVYDPLGRLFEVAGAGGAKTRFLYDGDRMIAEYDGSGTLTRRYVHGPGADEPVAVYEGPELGLANRRYTMTDERGSIAALVNADGTPWWINRYDAWGIPGVNKGRFQYTGQAWIGELGLYYYKARFYSPWLGRFMQTDPIGYEGGMNFYAYAGNDPVNSIDPKGLADLNLVGRHESQYDEGEDIDYQGAFTIFAHGGFQPRGDIGVEDHRGRGRPPVMSPSQLLKAAEAAGYRKGSLTLLLSCLAGQDKTNSFAQQYANLSGGRVVTSPGLIYPGRESGSFVTARAPRGFYAYDPKRNTATYIGDKVRYDPKTGEGRVLRDVTGTRLSAQTRVCLKPRCDDQ